MATLSEKTIAERNKIGSMHNRRHPGYHLLPYMYDAGGPYSDIRHEFFLSMSPGQSETYVRDDK